MSNLVSLHGEMVTRLTGLREFLGVPILSLDDQGYYKALGTALADEHGVCVAIGNPSGTPEATNVKGGQFTTTIRAYVFENQAVNRNRPLGATVANEEAKLTLSGVSKGARVHQTDVNKDFWLMIVGQESDPDQWAQVQVATELLELVVRAFQLWKPSAYQSMVSAGFEPGSADELHDYVARFSLVIGLDPTALTALT